MKLDLGTSLVLRDAVAADIPEVQDIAETAYYKYIERIGTPPGPMYANYTEELEKGHLHIVCQGELILGFAVFSMSSDEIYIDNLAIHPNHQSKGIGASFLRALENWGRENSMFRVRLFTNALMHENVRNYQVSGFQTYARILERGFDRVYMQKCIATQQTFPYFFDDSLSDKASEFLEQIASIEGLGVSWNLSGARLSNMHCGLKFGWLVLPGHGGWRGARGITVGFDSRERSESGQRLLTDLAGSKIATKCKRTEMVPEGRNTLEGFCIEWDDVWDDITRVTLVLETAVRTVDAKS